MIPDKRLQEIIPKIEQTCWNADPLLKKYFTLKYSPLLNHPDYGVRMKMLAGEVEIKETDRDKRIVLTVWKPYQNSSFRTVDYQLILRIYDHNTEEVAWNWCTAGAASALRHIYASLPGDNR